MLVAVGLYVSIGAALIIGDLSVPAAPHDPGDCQAMFSCLPTGFYVGMAIVVAGPFLIGLAIVTAIAAPFAARRLSSPILAGLASAGVSLVIVGAAAAVYLASRR